MIWFIILAAFILRIISLNQSLWLDESINVLAAKNYSFIGMVTEYAIADFHPPGFFIILWFWTKLFGINEIAVRIPSVIFGVSAVYITYLIGKKLYSKNLGIIGSLLLAVNPLHIYYSQDARMYSLATLAVAVNILLFIKLLKGEKLNLVLLILSNLAVFASDYVAYFIFPAQFIFLLIYKKKDLLKKYVLSVVGAVVLGLWWIPIFIKQLDMGASTAAQLPAWKFIVGAFDPKALPLTFVKFIIGRISYHDKLIYGFMLLPITLIFAYLLYRGIKFADKFNRKFLIIWLAVPISLATLVSFMIPIYSYFRVLYTIPSFLLLISLGILSFRSRLRYFFLTTVALIEIISASIYLSNPAFQREDWRGLVDFLRTKVSSITIFESSGNLPPFDYYARGEINARGALKNFPAKDDSDLADLENMLKDFKNVYLVNYLVDISDPNRLVGIKLESMGYKQVDILDFNGVGFLYNFRK